jgi:hypothetical protein
MAVDPPRPTNENILAGFLAFLDETLLEELRREISLSDPDNEGHDWARYRVYEWIDLCFAINEARCPLMTWITPFGIYYREDIINAYIISYIYHRTGKDPLAAFVRDYTPTRWIITWARKDDEYGQKFWNESRYERRPGDRLVRYDYPAGAGFMILRGNHRIAQCESLHMNIGNSPCLAWKEAKRYYDELGGVKGYLAGRFEWPVLGWVNPVKDVGLV